MRDFEGTGGLIGKRWANRMLNEELGLTEAELDRVDVRFLALFLEVNNMNVSVAGLVTLPQDRNYLDAVIARRPRQDYEFAKWEFMRRDALAEELVRPSKEYHPSSGLRMFLAGIVKFGVYEFGVQIVKEATKKKRDFTDPGSVALSDAPPQS